MLVNSKCVFDFFNKDDRLVKLQITDDSEITDYKINRLQFGFMFDVVLMKKTATMHV